LVTRASAIAPANTADTKGELFFIVSVSEWFLSILTGILRIARILSTYDFRRSHACPVSSHVQNESAHDGFGKSGRLGNLPCRGCTGSISLLPEWSPSKSNAGGRHAKAEASFAHSKRCREVRLLLRNIEAPTWTAMS